MRVWEGRELTEHVAEFTTTVHELLALRDWLEALGVTQVAMEATGVYLEDTGIKLRCVATDYYTRQNPERTTKRLVRQLEALGHQVTLEPREVAA